jgi:hypothetical protein
MDDTLLISCITGCNFESCGTYSVTDTLETGAWGQLEIDCPKWLDDFGPWPLDCDKWDEPEVTVVDCSENSACGWGVTCPAGGCGPEKFQASGFAETAASWAFTCTFTARSCCWNAPTWSVTFS